MVGEGREGAPEGPVSRPVRQQPLSRQRGGQREGTGHEARAWPTTQSPTSPPCAHWPSLIPEARAPLWLASQEPAVQGSCSLPCGGFPCSTRVSGPPRPWSTSRPLWLHSPPDPRAHSALVSSYLPGCSFCLSSPLLNTGGRQESVCKLHPYQDLRFLYFWCHGPFVSLPTPTI